MSALELGPPAHSYPHIEGIAWARNRFELHSLRSGTAAVTFPSSSCHTSVRAASARSARMMNTSVASRTRCIASGSSIPTKHRQLLAPHTPGGSFLHMNGACTPIPSNARCASTTTSAHHRSSAACSTSFSSSTSHPRSRALTPASYNSLPAARRSSAAATRASSEKASPQHASENAPVGDDEGEHESEEMEEYEFEEFEEYEYDESTGGMVPMDPDGEVEQV